MGKLADLMHRLTGKDGRGEADVIGDDARSDSRGPNDSYVGRTAEDDDFTGESGAERQDPNGDPGRHRRS